MIHSRGERNASTAADPVVRDLEAQPAASSDDAANAALRVWLTATRTEVRSAKLGEVVAEFEAVHNVPSHRLGRRYFDRSRAGAAIVTSPSHVGSLTELRGLPG